MKTPSPSLLTPSPRTLRSIIITVSLCLLAWTASVLADCQVCATHDVSGSYTAYAPGGTMECYYTCSGVPICNPTFDSISCSYYTPEQVVTIYCESSNCFNGVNNNYNQCWQSCPCT
jgi:hypothetical protein